MKFVSACLLGVNCRYDGGRNTVEELIREFKKGKVIPVCPEQLGGLATPREPSEIVGGTGEDVLDGKARVKTKDGRDVTEDFIRGAKEVLKLARLAGAKSCVFKRNSPSCGKGWIYDGSFSGKLKPGGGVTTALLEREGIDVEVI